MAASLALTACAMPGPVPQPDQRQPADLSETRAVVTPQPRPASPAPPESAALAESYRRTEARLVEAGRLRTDGGERDARFDAAHLADSFLQVALYEEYVVGATGLVARTSPATLRRWEAPVRIGILFGASVDDEARRRDRRTRDRLAVRLADATGHDIAPAEGAGNVTIYVLREDERRAFLPRLAAREPDLTAAILAALDRLPASQFCVVVGLYDDDAPAVLRRALVFIRAEHPPLLRLSCFHEELAQGLGLTNDSPTARPSIFNDDEEFALLTPMDELMLRILYDPRLETGMSPEEAAPVVRDLAAEALDRTVSTPGAGPALADEQTVVAATDPDGGEG